MVRVRTMDCRRHCRGGWGHPPSGPGDLADRPTAAPNQSGVGVVV